MSCDVLSRNPEKLHGLVELFGLRGRAGSGEAAFLGRSVPGPSKLYDIGKHSWLKAGTRALSLLYPMASPDASTCRE